MTKPKITETDISKLTPDPNNARKRTPLSASVIRKSLEQFGAARSIVVDENDVIRAGNGTFEEAGQLGIEKVVTIEVDGNTIVAVKRKGLTEEQWKQYAIADNTASDFSTWDFDILNELTQEVDLSEFFPDDKLNELLEQLGKGESFGVTEQGEENEEEIAELLDKVDEIESRVKLGEIWSLGRHKLIVNDCADVVGINQLLDNATVDMIFTDPPYGVKRDKGFEGFGGFGEPIKRRRYEDDDWDDTIPDKAIFDFLLGLNAKTFIFGGNFFAHLLPQSTHWIFWDKVQTMPTFGDGELVWTNSSRKSIKKSIKKYVFQYNGLLGKEKERYHPTQKPVGIIELIINDYSEQNEIILDPFLGSGTTLIAAEKTGRTCYGCEISLKYATIILERWERFTGQEAKLISP